MKNNTTDPSINEWILERYDLVLERLTSIADQASVQAPFDVYFKQLAEDVLFVSDVYKCRQEGVFARLSEDERAKINHRLFEDVLPENYAHSFLNPAFAVETLGQELGQYLSWLCAQQRDLITYAFQNRFEEMTAYMELVVEIYNRFEEAVPTAEEVKNSIYWYVSDYSDLHRAHFIREMLDPSLSYYKEIITDADLETTNYLYDYPLCITENEKKIAAFMKTLPQEEIDAMAKTMVDGYVRGFEVYKIDLSEKKTVELCGNVGFERVMRSAIQQFKAVGLDTVIGNRAIAVTSLNPQVAFDHKFDEGLYLDKALCERLVGVTRSTFENYKAEAAVYGGPCVMEIFGEEPFEPQAKPENVKLSDKQQQLFVQRSGKFSEVYYKYIDPNKRSFSIIAWPIPAIGDQFETIFKETIKVNNLDNATYIRIQQTIIDAMDGASYAHILGMNGNRTDLKVSLWQLKDPAHETVFENCTADVNIPVGEVFTSPVLKGTDGILNVSSVYLNDLNYKDLMLRFEDGCVVDYDCANYEDPEENRKYMKENLMQNRPTLPMGEFAIGTNTTAYVMARKYAISPIMPILIMEKTGPHFAIGDTCYSYSEDHKVYNPDGKEIVARENEKSALRNTEPEKAYFNVHTDITIPYNELGLIKVVFPDGSETEIIREGRFVLPGTEELNIALDEA